MNIKNNINTLEDAIEILKNYKESYIDKDKFIKCFNNMDKHIKTMFNTACNHTDDIDFFQGFISCVGLVSSLKHYTDNRSLIKRVSDYIDKIEYDKSIFSSNPVRSDKKWGLYDVDDTYVLKFYSAEERDEGTAIYTTRVYADMIISYEGKVERKEVKFKTFGDLKDALDYKTFI